MFRIFLIAAVLTASCNNGPDTAIYQKTPEDALRAYYAALEKMDIEFAYALGTDLTKRQLHLLGVFMNMSSEEEISNKKKQIQMNLKELKCAESSGKMLCTVCCGEGESKKEVEMVLQQGKWFVHQHLGMQDMQKKE